MGDRAAAERACKDPNPIIDGRKANVNLAILGAKPRGNLAPGMYTNLAQFFIFRFLTERISYAPTWIDMDFILCNVSNSY